MNFALRFGKYRNTSKYVYTWNKTIFIYWWFIIFNDIQYFFILLNIQNNPVSNNIKKSYENIKGHKNLKIEKKMGF